ncbi:MAG: alpha/beta fold hydrolase [Flavobacteriales bacterium]|nr:alpha/beta fold hydrolase [Flavobacteriales bacterium]MCB9194158.1 alpha/beta fold hydrolase [Flavobacteriales bacterium]
MSLLLLLHGFPLDNTLWAPQVEGLSGITDVIAPDLRGFGEDARAVPEVMTMEAYARDVNGLLDDRGIDRVVLGGLSMGGYVAMAFAEAWPERLAGLLLINTRATADDEAGKRGREDTAQRALGQGMTVIARAMVPTLLSERTRQRDPALATGVEALIARQRTDAVAAASRGMATRPDRHAALASVPVPTLIVTGEHDMLMPLPTSLALQAAVPNADLVVIPGAAHLSNLEEPAAFNAAVGKFLATIR